MYLSYEEFSQIMTKHVPTGKEFYRQLIKAVIQNPSRYYGTFRLTDPKTKLIQNITQSCEIKFGDAIEEITTKYIEKLGYKNLPKNLITKNNEKLNIDQLFKNNNSIFLVEMKMRDDHDSTKKRGQFLNFEQKLKLIRNTYKDAHINGIMWFVDNQLSKNKNYYISQMNNGELDNTCLSLCYGHDFFALLDNGEEAWNEFITLLKQYKANNSVSVNIPDFGTSQEILDILIELPKDEWEKLISDKPEYKLVRQELFGNGDNIQKAKKIRSMY